MANICLMFGTKAPVETVMATLNTLEGLSKWWTPHTTGSTAKGGEILFRFPETGPDMRVLESTPNKVLWKCTNGPTEWIGTHLSFDVSERDGQTILMFKHADWAEEVPFFHFCSTKWALFLLSLRDYLETGQGRAFPNDIPVTHD